MSASIWNRLGADGLATVVDTNYNAVVVIGTNNPATDAYNLQLAINEAVDYAVIKLRKAFSLETLINVKSKLTIINDGGATITTTQQCVFYVKDNTDGRTGGNIADGYPGRLRILGIELIGPGAPVSLKEALGTYTKANHVGAIHIEANLPFCEITCNIQGFDVGVHLEDAYCSKIGGNYVANNYGIMIFSESHNTVLDNPLTEACFLGVGVNYGNNGSITQNLCTVQGAYQNGTVGIWLEKCQSTTSSGTVYFEGNTCRDIVNGVNDALAYNRTASFTRMRIETSSPCATTVNSVTPVNISSSHSSDVLFECGFYAGTTTSGKLMKEDGAGDRICFDVFFINPAFNAPSNTWNPFDFADLSRVLVKRTSLLVQLVGQPGVQYRSTTGQMLANLQYNSASGIGGLEIRGEESDVRIKATSRVRLQNLAGTQDYVVANAVDGRVESRMPHVHYSSASFEHAEMYAPALATAPAANAIWQNPRINNMLMLGTPAAAKDNRISHGAGVGSRDSLILQNTDTNSDVLIRCVGGQGTVRIADSTNNVMFEVDLVNNVVKSYLPLRLTEAAQLLRTDATLTNYAAAAAGTLTNAPVAGNPTKWIAINDNGTVRRIPAW